MRTQSQNKINNIPFSPLSYTDEFMTEADLEHHEKSYDKRTKVFISHDEPAESHDFQEELQRIMYGR